MTEPRGPARIDPQDLLAQLQRVRDAQVGEALRLLEERREALADAHGAVEAARDEVHRAIRRLGAVQVAAQEQPPVDLLRELYWGNPEVRVDQMAAAFGFRHVAEIAALVGPDERPLPCHRGCGRTVRRRRKNRTDTTYRRGAQDPRLCATCREQVAQQEQERLTERQERYRRRAVEDEALLVDLHAMLAAGETPSSTYVEYRDLPGVWRVHEDGTRERVL